LVSITQSSGSRSASIAKVDDIPTTTVTSGQIMTALDIPVHFSDCTDRGIQAAFQKWKVVLAAIQRYKSMESDGTWLLAKQSDTDIVQLCIGKSFWYSHYQNKFKKVANHPMLVKWLNGEDDASSDLELWGTEKTSYNFTDLEKWLQEKESSDTESISGYQKKGKGKTKENDKGKGKEKEKGRSHKKKNSAR
jgi:hypothetical protein